MVDYSCDSPSPSLPSPCPSSSLKPSSNEDDDRERASGFKLNQNGLASEPTIYRCHYSNPSSLFPLHPPPPSPSVPEKTLNVSPTLNSGLRGSTSAGFSSSALLNSHYGCLRSGLLLQTQSFHFMLLPRLVWQSSPLLSAPKSQP